MVPLKQVQSTMIAAHGYDSTSRTLAVRFNGSEHVHHFKDVPPEAADGLERADSAGRYFNTYIRGKFEHTTVNAVAYGAEQEPAPADEREFFESSLS